MKIVPLTLREANDFVEQHHRHSARTANDGGKFAIGLVVSGSLVGAAIVGRPVARMLQHEGTAEVLRCCVSPSAPKGACGALYARCKRIWQLMGGRRLVTYTLASEPGASLRGHFHDEGELRGRRWDTPTRARPHREIELIDKRRWSASLPDVPA